MYAGIPEISSFLTNHSLTPCASDYGAVEIRLINALGQIIDVYSFDSSKAVKLTIDEAPGAYILEVVTDELNPARVKVLKE